MESCKNMQSRGIIIQYSRVDRIQDSLLTVSFFTLLAFNRVPFLLMEQITHSASTIFPHAMSNTYTKIGIGQHMK